MKNQYNILFGLAILISLGVGYGYNKNRYFLVKTGEEIPKVIYEQLEDKNMTLVESIFNLQAGVTAGLATIGAGLVLMGLTNKRSAY
ncbi:hypothetical protein [Nibribacter koreensis]|uniref:Uncharacterized protein n=1 Tax=Nibribacter koreensis TaxID=1084519 RepID=A0ABP8F9F1_9BACT